MTDQTKIILKHNIELSLSSNAPATDVAALICDFFTNYYKDDDDRQYALLIFNEIYKKYSKDELPATFFSEFVRLYVNILRENSSMMSSDTIDFICSNIIDFADIAIKKNPKSNAPYLYLARFYNLNINSKLLNELDTKKLTKQYFLKAINLGSKNAVKEYNSFLNTLSAATSFDFLNVNINLNKIVDALLNNIDKDRFSLLLYGPEGSGKSIFAQHLIGKIKDFYNQHNLTFKIVKLSPFNFDENLKNISETTTLIQIDDNFGIALKDIKHCYLLLNKIKKQTNNIIVSINSLDNLPKDFISNFLFKIKFNYMNQEQEEAAYELFFNNKAPEELKSISGMVISDFNRIQKTCSVLNINKNADILNMIKDEMFFKFGNNNYNKPIIQFDSKMINCDTDVEVLIEKLKYYDPKYPFSILVYGPPGTGKSYFLRYLAQNIGISTVEKKPAEMFSKYQGQPAKEVLNIFKEAQDKNAMLIIDEIEGIISERSKDSGENKWKSDMTNSFLSSLESCTVPFAGTSNHLKFVDKAILRRFVFKLHFDYLTTMQAIYAFEKIFGLIAPYEKISKLKHLTSGDFSIVKRKALILGCINDAEKLCDMLNDEIAKKEL